MKASQIKVGGIYLAKIGGAVVPVRVDAIRDIGPNAGRYIGQSAARSYSTTRYDVTNLKTKREVTFRSAAKFREEINPKYFKCDAGCGKEWVGANKPWTCSDCSKKANRSDPTVPPAVASASTDSLPSQARPDTFREQDADCSDLGVIADAIMQPSCKTCRCSPCACQEAEQRSDPTPLALATSAAGNTPPNPASATVLLTATTTPKPSGTTSGGVTASNAAPTSLLAAITAANADEPTAPTIAGMTPTDEQRAGLDEAVRLFRQQATGFQRVLVMKAGAGCGKTAEFRMVEQVLNGSGQYTAFNKSLVEDARGKFVKASVATTHALAFRTVGKLYAHRLPGKPGNRRLRSSEIAQILGIEDQVLPTGEKDEDGNPRTRRFKASWLAGQVLVAIRRFCQSADAEIGPSHIRVDGADRVITEQAEDGTEIKRRDRTNSDKIAAYLLPFARKAWADLKRTDGSLPFSHDCYVKLWQLGTGAQRPVIEADYILLDEYQDTAPVFLDVLMQQTHALLILVGDDNQRIYEWRGAVNAGDYFPSAPVRLLSQSFRFGQVVADVANTILAGLEKPTELVMRGLSKIPSRVCKVASPQCYLYRTNAGAVSCLMRGIREGKRGHLIGGSKEVVDFCKAAIDLQQSRGTQHSELGCFETWDEVVAYSQEDEGEDLRLMVKLIEDFTAEAIRDALENMPKERDADFIATTAHKSKGREWPSVKLGGDFPTANKLEDSDRRLIYVAATRAEEELDTSECPTFCGGWDGMGEARKWIPGIRVAYTVPMPTEEALAAYRAEKASRAAKSPTPAATAPTSPAGPTTAQTAPVATVPATGNGNPAPAPSGEAIRQMVAASAERVVTFTKLPGTGEWGLWASAEIKPGEEVTIRTRTGAIKRERVGRIVYANPQAKKWLATIAR